jgi:hypothetical protein
LDTGRIGAGTAIAGSLGMLELLASGDVFASQPAASFETSAEGD